MPLVNLRSDILSIDFSSAFASTEILSAHDWLSQALQLLDHTEYPTCVSMVSQSMGHASTPCQIVLTNPQATAPMNPQTDSRLMALPPELRNNIYRHVLTGFTITFPAAGPVQSHPTLLHTCRIIRKEALGIFLQEADLILQVVDYDCTRLQQFSNLSAPHWDSLYDIELSGRQSWRNLHDWLEAYYKRDCHGFWFNREDDDDDDDDELRVKFRLPHRLFRLVDEMKEDESADRDWDEACKILRKVHACIAAVCPVWA